MSTMEEMCEQMMMEHSSMGMVEMGHDAGHKEMMQSNHTSETSECEMSVDCDCNTGKTLTAANPAARTERPPAPRAFATRPSRPNRAAADHGRQSRAP